MENIKVLFINSDMLFCNIITNALQAKSYDVNCQHSTTGLSEIIRAFSPDIILLDTQIGNEDGIATIPNIQLIVPNIPIIFVSLHNKSHEVQRALQQGAIIYLTRPLDTEILIAHIERHARPYPYDTIAIGSLTMNLHTRILNKGSIKIKKLSKLEFELLKMLYENRNQLVLSETLRMTGKDTSISEHTLYNYIRKLREILSKDNSISLTTQSNGYELQISS